jgi:hypothetical protein
MRWIVEGADSSTGRETAMTVEARTREEAEQQARYNGLLVSVVYPHGSSRPHEAGAVNAPAVVNYAGPTTPPPQREPPPPPPPVAPATEATGTAIPTYDHILADARHLRRLSTVSRIVGFVALTLAGYRLIMPFVGGYSSIRLPSLWDIIDALSNALAPGAIGLLLLIASAALSMMASAALALRDMARNSAARSCS